MTDLHTLASPWGIDLSAQQIDQFATYETLLIEWNTRMNLTAIRDPAGIRTRHFLDALTCSTVTGNLNNQHLIDIGTGAGFPGLPLKILYPNLHLTLVDSVAKKTKFLQAIVDTLALPHVTILTERAETLGQHPAYRAQFDWVVARAVAQFRILAEYLLPLCRPKGHILAQKGHTAPQEAEQASQALTILGGSPPTIHPITLPGRHTPHHLIISQKIAPTPPRYPRRPGIPTKRPL